MVDKENMDDAYIFAVCSGNFGKWAYNLNGGFKYGESKGTTLDQMYLMGVLQVLRDAGTRDAIRIFIGDERTYKRINGEYKGNEGIITEYLNEISWATGQKRIEYIYFKDITSHPFNIAAQRIFQGRTTLYFNLDEKDARAFEVEDVFNNNNVLKGWLCRISDTRYGMLYIESVNGEYCPQWVWATPKIRYPFDMNGEYYSYDADKIEIYEKLDGTNILAYIYEDANEERYVTYKTRLTPIVRDGTYGRFEKMWKELLIEYPKIPDFCLDNKINASFEMYGSRNPILIQYDVKLNARLLFCRTQDGLLHTPSSYNLGRYGLESTELWKVLDSANDFKNEYERAVQELNSRLEVVEIPDAADIVSGWEGAVWYALKEDEVIPLKCKPDYIRDIHFFAAAGIPKHSIYITCMNVFESIERPTLEDVLELLREEFQEVDIQRKILVIESLYRHVYEQMILRNEVIEEYEKHPEFDINMDKGKVMRYFSGLYDKKMMSRVYTLLWNEFSK